MEFEVRVVGGIESCFISLPLSLIQTLQSTCSGILPPVLALELRSRDDDLWHVAWSGSASMSSAIEVAQQLAECISLPDHMTVQVRAVANLPKATLVTIEPNSEDDWEVMELNSEHAEAAILKQVAIVHEGMRFPLWLHGRTVVVFLVVSTFPKKLVVQLVPGTEVAVAPKRRKKNVGSYKDSNLEASNKEQSMTKALLRVQDPDKKLVHRSEVKGVELGVVLTSVVFIHPETAKNALFDNLEPIVIFPRLLLNENMKKHKNDTLRKKNSSTAKERNGIVLTDKEASGHAIVRLLLSDSVSKGHVMLPQSLRLYLGVGQHSWVQVKRCNISPKKDIPLLKISPCQFKLIGKNKDSKENGSGVLDSLKNRKTKNVLLRTNLVADADILDWSIHEEVAASLSCVPPISEEEEAPSQSRTRKAIQSLLHAWFLGQLGAVASNTGVDMSSLVLGNETLLHFEVKRHKFRNHAKEQVSCGASLENRNRAGEPPVELLYLLNTSEESLHSGQDGTYELAFKEENKSNSNLGGLELSFGKLDLGDPVSFESAEERTLDKSFSSTISSLSWMETAASDVIKRRADNAVISIFWKVVHNL
ncbi:hypothetical protein HHK36_000718 [Tetracentron sinense]|uniref:Peroxisomal ATPase PEX1 N-terminal C-lobe domain-containing protein n=1 Tax=Tetracentron sinense TaxID=13715 RepID=A0A834ZS23_TETSI|nr:hypothetical protein HHK36_000718 [Tetracentron sinense]